MTEVNAIQIRWPRAMRLGKTQNLRVMIDHTDGSEFIIGNVPGSTGKPYKDLVITATSTMCPCMDFASSPRLITSYPSACPVDIHHRVWCKHLLRLWADAGHTLDEIEHITKRCKFRRVVENGRTLWLYDLKMVTGPISPAPSMAALQYLAQGS